MHKHPQNVLTINVVGFNRHNGIFVSCTPQKHRRNENRKHDILYNMNV